MEKSILHPRNKHRNPYDFNQLIKKHPLLSHFVVKNKYNSLTIDFNKPEAVRALNTALLIDVYGIEYWEFPKENLCPPIPGRVDYIHYLADLLSEDILKGPSTKVKCLDIGTGASCIYPILGNAEYNWHFVASDIDNKSIESAQSIINMNKKLKGKVEFRLQKNPKYSFNDIINKKEYFDLSICNPPFHKSKKAAEEGAIRKQQNLKNKDINMLNFSGQSNELWCKGGEKMFIKNMIKESKKYSKNCKWFTTLVSKKEHLNSFYDALKKIEATDVRTIDMAQGNKRSRILAWSFIKNQTVKK